MTIRRDRNRVSLGVLSLLLAAGGLVGCQAVGPDYNMPEVSTPGAWATPLPAGLSNDPATLAGWWRMLGDEKLNGLVERAIGGNLDLRLAAQRVMEARAQRGTTMAGYGPNVNATGSYGRNAVSENTGSPFSRPDEGQGHDLWTAGLDASWEIDVFGGLRRGVEAADADILTNEWSRRDVLVTLIGDVATNYVQLRTAQARIAVARSNVQTQQKTLDLTGNRVKAGLSSDLDTSRARGQLATTIALVPLLEAEARQAIYRLSVLTGRDPGALVAELEPEGPIPGIPGALPVGVPADLVRRRPDVRAAERGVAAATARIGVETAELYPHFTLAGDIGLSAEQIAKFPEGNSRFFGIGPGVRWSIFNAGLVRSNIHVQEWRTEQALTRYEGSILTAMRDVDAAIIGLQKQRERVAALQEGETAQTRAAELSNELYTKGLSGFLDVLVTQRDLLEVQDLLTESRGAATLQLVALYKALGGGWEPEKAAGAAATPEQPAAASVITPAGW